MDDTEKYLNEILKKRLGSVANYSGSSKTATTVTRVPKQQEKPQSMPTVFRKKQQTVYLQANNSQYSQKLSEYLSVKEPSMKSKAMEQQMPQQKQTASQRVEYMLISKRIQSLKEDDVERPAVDVTNYSKARNSQLPQNKKTQLRQQNQPPANNPSYEQEWTSNKMPRGSFQNQHTERSVQNNSFDSVMSSNTDKSKRKRIFGMK